MEGRVRGVRGVLPLGGGEGEGGGEGGDALGEATSTATKRSRALVWIGGLDG